MMTQATHLIALLWFSGMRQTFAAGSVTNAGTDFYFTVMTTGHDGGSNYVWAVPVTVGEVTVEVTFEIFPRNFGTISHIVPTEGTAILIDIHSRAKAAGLSQTNIFIQATRPITAMVVTIDTSSDLHQEAALLLPVPALGLFHIVTPFHADRTSFITVVATQDNTRVRVYSLPSYDVQILEANVTFGVHEVYSIELQKALVIADSPVAVFTGSNSAANLNHMLEQVAPLQTWGKTHFAYFYGPNMTNWMLPQGQTMASQNGSALGGNYKTVEEYSSLSDANAIQTNKPSVLIRLENPYNTGSTRPCRVNVIPREQWLIKYTFHIGMGGTDIIVVVDDGDESGILMNGNTTSTAHCTHSSGGMRQCTLYDNPIGRYVFTSNVDKPMAVYLHREDATSAICVQAGAGLNVLNQEWVNPCPVFFNGTTSISGLEIPLETLCDVDPVSVSSSLDILPSSTAPLLSSDVESLSLSTSTEAGLLVSSSSTLNIDASSTLYDVPSSSEVYGPSLSSEGYGSLWSSGGNGPPLSPWTSESATYASVYQSLHSSREEVVTGTEAGPPTPSMWDSAGSHSPPSTPGVDSDASSPPALSVTDVTALQPSMAPGTGVTSLVSSCYCQPNAFCSTMAPYLINRLEIYASVKDALFVDPRNTSSYRRKRISIPDIRTSSTVIASGGIAIMCIIFGLVILPDVITLIRYVTRKCSNHVKP